MMTQPHNKADVVREVTRVLCEMEGMSRKQIAEAAGIHVNTLYKSLRRGSFTNRLLNKLARVIELQIELPTHRPVRRTGKRGRPENLLMPPDLILSLGKWLQRRQTLGRKNTFLHLARILELLYGFPVRPETLRKLWREQKISPTIEAFLRRALLMRVPQWSERRRAYLSRLLTVLEVEAGKCTTPQRVSSLLFRRAQIIEASRDLIYVPEHRYCEGVIEDSNQIIEMIASEARNAFVAGDKDMAREFLAYVCRQYEPSREETRRLHAQVLGHTAWIYYFDGSFEHAISTGEESMQLYQVVGDDWGREDMYSLLGLANIETERHNAGAESLRQSVLLARKYDSEDVVTMIWNRGYLAHRVGDLPEAHLLYRCCVDIDLEFGSDNDAYSLEWYAVLASDVGNYNLAAFLDGVAAEMRTRDELPLSAWEQRKYRSMLKPALAALPIEKFSRLRREGAQASAQEAVERAIRYFDSRLGGEGAINSSLKDYVIDL